MTVNNPVEFLPEGTHVKVVLQDGSTFEALEMNLDNLRLRKDWVLPQGVSLVVDGPAVGLPAGSRMRAFVPWWNIRYMTQIIPAEQ